LIGSCRGWWARGGGRRRGFGRGNRRGPAWQSQTMARLAESVVATRRLAVSVVVTRRPIRRLPLALKVFEWQATHGLETQGCRDRLARQTGATVIVPMYPLATTEAGRATVVIPDAADFISHQIELSGGAENVSVYAVGRQHHAISAVRQRLLSGKPVPSSMVLVSLAVDSTLQNPDIRAIDDPLFDIDNLDVWDSHWYDGITDRRDPLVSPLFFETETLKGLPPTTICVGEREILLPYAASAPAGSRGGRAGIGASRYRADPRLAAFRLAPVLPDGGGAS
jgi:hypothetical protein